MTVNKVPRGSRRPPARLGLWAGYRSLIIVGCVAAVLVAVVPSDGPGDGATGAGAAVEVAVGQTASGGNESVLPCDDRRVQREGDGYSPPCFEFDGDNGGETSRGVSDNTVTISYRVTSDPSVYSTFAQLSGLPFEETHEDLVRTAEGLVDYFNQNFQFYGRRLDLVEVAGRGSVNAELGGGGQEAASNDAIKVANEVEAFADMTGETQPYADALARNQVVSVGAPFPSRQWFQERRPYAWSNLPDCTLAAEAAMELAGHLLGQAAEIAGGDLAGRPRTIGLIAPNNPEYQQCADTAEQALDDAGHPVDLRQDYVMDLAQLQTQVASLLAQLKANDITSVACFCDPEMVMSLAQQAEQQDYRPEWLVMGVGYLDLDLVGQVISGLAGDQWTRAFGASSWAPLPAPGAGEAYAAYKSVREDEPSLLVDLVYYQLYRLVIGIQMAGPELTPENFETGMFSYPGGNGPAGRWDFHPDNYTGISDARVVWWDPDAPSPFNSQPGAYLDDGARYEQGEIPPDAVEVLP